MIVLATLLALPLGVQITEDQVRAESRLQLDSIKARLDLARAGEQYVIARSTILPQVNVNFSASYYLAGPTVVFATIPVSNADGTTTYVQQDVSTPGSVQTNFLLNATINQLIYDGGKWWNLIAQAGAQEDAARGLLAEQRLTSELEAVRRFYALLNAQNTLLVLQATVRRSEEQVQRAESLFTAGRSPKSAVFDAMTSLANDRTSVIRQRQAITEARLALLQWLRRPDQDIEAVAPSDIGSRTDFPTVERAIEIAHEQRPLLMSLAAQVRANVAGEKVAFAGFLPSLSGSIGYRRAGPTVRPFFSDITKQNAFQVTGVINWDVFNGLATRGAHRQAKIESERARAVAEQATIDMEAEIRRTYQAAKTEAEVLALATSNYTVAKEQLALEEQRFAAGAGSGLDFRNAQIKFAQAELAIVAGQASVAIANVAVERSVGGKFR